MTKTEETAKRIAELHYPNKPNAIIDEPYRQARMETLRRQVETELKSCSIPAVNNRSELLAFMDWVIDEEGMTTNEERTSPESFVDDYIKASGADRVIL